MADVIPQANREAQAVLRSTWVWWARFAEAHMCRGRSAGPGFKGWSKGSACTVDSGSFR